MNVKNKRREKKKSQRELYIAKKENMSKEQKDKMKEQWRKNTANQRARMTEKKKHGRDTSTVVSYERRKV